MKFSILITFLFVFIIQLSAQQNGLLTEREHTKIERADKKIDKAEAIVNKKEKYADQLQSAESQGRMGKVRRLKTKSNKIVIQSASYFKDGYGQKYKTYKKAVAKGVKTGDLGDNSAEILSTANSEYKLGRKYRRKSAGENDVNAAVDLLFKANDIEIKAIEKLSSISKEASVKIEEPVSVLEDSVVEVIDSSKIALMADTLVQEVPQVVMPVDTMQTIDSTLVVNTMGTLTISTDTIQSVPVMEPEIPAVKEESNGMDELYFSVQFLAEKQAASKTKLTSLYDGPFEILQHEADGWFRYSFGKFKTWDEANEMKNRSGVEAYVVAYYKEERISTRRAKEMLLNSNL